MVQTVITAVIGGIVAFLFWHIERKIDTLEKEQEKRHEEQIGVRIAERDVLLAVADTTLLTAKKVNNRNSVNGELEASIERLQEKNHALQEMTTQIYFKHTV